MGVDMDSKVESYLSSHDEGRIVLLSYSPIPKFTMKRMGKYKRKQTESSPMLRLMLMLTIPVTIMTMTVAVTATMAPTTHHADSHEVTQETKKPTYHNYLLPRPHFDRSIS